jgi:hypothetical protein
MRRIKYSAKRKEIKVKKSKFGILAHSAILALEVFELEIVKLRRFFPAISPSVIPSMNNYLHFNITL